MCKAPGGRDGISTYHTSDGSTELSAHPRRLAMSLEKRNSLPTPSASVNESERIYPQSNGNPAHAPACASENPHARPESVGPLSNTNEHFGYDDGDMYTLPADAGDGADPHGILLDELNTPETYFPGAPKLDSGHQFAAPKIIHDLTQLAIEAFHAENTRPTSKRSRSPEPQRSRKRTRVATLDGSRAVEVSEGEDSDTIVVDQPVGRIWACPFYLKDAERHRTCVTRHCLLTIDDVMEHLCLMHREPKFCPVCYDTFPTAKERDSHVRSWQCRPRESVTFEGLTIAQVYHLNEKMVTEEDRPRAGIEQWFDIWQIVFPQLAPPVSPFFSARRELNVYRMRRIWRANGQAIISNELKKHGLQRYSIENEERNLEALYDLVQNLAVDKLWRPQIPR